MNNQNIKEQLIFQHSLFKKRERERKKEKN